MTKHQLTRPVMMISAAAVLSVVCAGCQAGTAGSPVAGKSAVASSSAPTGSGTSSSSNDNGPNNNGTVTNASTPECRNADIRVGEQFGGGYTGHEAEILTFTDASGHACFLQGFPGAALTDSSGHVLLNATRTMNGFVGGAIANGGTGFTSPPHVDLTPNQSVIAVLEYEDNDIQNVPGGCQVRRSAELLVTAPDSTTSTRLPGLIDVCDAFEINPVIDKAPH